MFLGGLVCFGYHTLVPVQFGACVLSSSVITRAKEVCSSRVLSPVFIFWFLGSDESSFLLFYQY